MIKYLSRYLPRHSLDQIYKLHVRPHFDYCDVIYHIPNHEDPFSGNTAVHYLMSRLESVQYSAALAITGAWKGTSGDKIYHELGWETLADRRWYRRLTLFYKIINGLTPSYLKAIIPDATFHRYGLRHSDCIPSIRHRNETFKNSFFPFCIEGWNHLDPEIRNAPSLAMFKSRLIKLIRPNKYETYGVYDPNGLRFLTQLRVGLSVLREHKFRHSFCDTSDPMCLLNDGVENTEHYMLLCQDFNQQRTLLFRKVFDVLSEMGVNVNDLSQCALLHILLYGDSRLNCTLNRRIISATLEYISETGRMN